MLTERRRRFAQAYAETGNGREAARRAGYATPAVEGTRVLADDSVKQAIEDYRAQAGLTADLVARTVVRGMQADDVNASLRAADIGARLLDLYAPAIDARTVNLQLPEGMSLSDVAALAALDTDED